MSTLWQSLWSQNTGLGQAIICLIIFVFFRTLFRASAGFNRLQSEQGQLDEIKTRVGEALKKKNKGPLGITRLVKEDDKPSLALHRLSTIAALRNRRVKINLSTLQGLTIGRLRALTELAAPARGAHAAMMLGILGTFLGLAVLVQDIKAVLPAAEAGWNPETWTQGLQNVAAVVAGIKTAFSTSLVGMGASLLLTLIGHKLTDHKQRYLSNLEDFTVESLLPNLALDLEDKSLFDGVSRRIEEAFDQLETSFSRNESMLDRLSGIQESYLDIVNQIRELTGTQSGQGMVELAEGLAQANTSILTVAETLPRAVTAIERSQQQFLARLNPLHLMISGVSSLWTARLPFGIPGSLVMILLFMTAVAWVHSVVV